MPTRKKVTPKASRKGLHVIRPFGSLANSKPYTSRPVLAALVAFFVVFGLFVVFRSRAATNPGDPSTAANNGTDTSCVFNKADQPTQVAFCDGFSSAVTGNPIGSRSGELNNTLWGVSRLHQWNPMSMINNVLPSEMVGCGATIAMTPPPADVRICGGRVLESQDDNHGVVDLTMYPKQPFDFAGRTGTVAFDVSADSDGSHGAWPEFVITDKPYPGVRTDISAHNPPTAANQIGFALDGCSAGPGGTTGVGEVFMSKGFVYSNVPFTSVGCVQKSGHASGPLNHFETRVSQSRIEIWGSDPGGANFQLLAFADNLNLGFSRGLVWMNDVHYNARKAIEPCECGTQYHHTFAWDNLGFDGPKTYRDLSFDVPDANIGPNPDGTYTEGYNVGTAGITLRTIPVYRYQSPTSALVTFNYYSFADSDIPTVSVNGHPAVATPWPFTSTYKDGNGNFIDGGGYYERSLAVTVPVADTVDGVNTLTLKATDQSTSVANVNLILVAAAAVPGQTIPSATPTVAPTPQPTPTPTPQPVATPTPIPSLSYDLVASSIAMAPVVPAASQAVAFSATIKNIGAAATPDNFPLGMTFTLDGGTSSTWYWNPAQPSIPAGGSINVTANGPTGAITWGATPGTHSVEVFVDDLLRLCPSSQGGNCLGVAAELTTANNKLLRQITIAALVTPAPTVTPSATPLPTSTPLPTPAPSCTKPGDANCDGKVNNSDLSTVLRNYGKPTSLRPQGDLTGDGQVNIFDLSQVLQNWGK